MVAAAAGEDFTSFALGFVGGTLIRDGARQTRTARSEAVSGALKRRGFTFVGPLIVRAWMQATGLVDDHDPRCFRTHGT